MSRSTIAQEGVDIRRACDMIRLGAKLQVLRVETRLSHERLSRLYQDIRGRPAPTGTLPHSPKWYLTWLPNLHASVFYSIYNRLFQQGERSGPDTIIEAYKLYLEQVQVGFLPDADGRNRVVLDFTRAWTLLRLFDGGFLCRVRCGRCCGLFVAQADAPDAGYLCGICGPPIRAGRRALAHRRAQVLAAPRR